jgi:lipoprotein-releasing system permease protein
MGVNAHVDVLKTVPDFSEYRDVLRRVERDDNVLAAGPFIFLECYISSAGQAPVSVALKGVDPQRVAKILDLSAYMKIGKISDLSNGEPPPIILGETLAKKLKVDAGDRVTVTLATLDGQQQAREYPFRVSGAFYIGFAEYDERLAFTSLAAAQLIANRGDQVLGIEIKIKDIHQSARVARAIEQALGGSPYQAMDWYELNRQLFMAMFGERRP